MISEVVQFELANISVTDPYRSLTDIPKPQQQVGNRAFAGADAPTNAVVVPGERENESASSVRRACGVYLKLTLSKLIDSPCGVSASRPGPLLTGTGS